MTIQLGDKVSVKVKRHKTSIIINGKVKEVKRSYGNDEFLITETTTSEFWVRNCKKI